MKLNSVRCSKKELRKQLESVWQKLAETETRALEAEALVASQRRLLGEADKKLTALEDRVRELEEAFRNRRDCTGCTHYDNAANKPLSRQFCLTCSRRAKDKFECVCKNNDS